MQQYFSQWLGQSHPMVWSIYAMKMIQIEGLWIRLEEQLQNACKIPVTETVSSTY